MSLPCSFFFFFFNDTATTEIYTLSLHDALPISHDIPVLLHEQGARAGRVHGDPVHAVTDLGILIGDGLRTKTAVHRSPCFAAIIGPEDAGRRDGDEYAPGIAWILHDRMEAHPSCPGRPRRPGRMLAQSGQFVPRLSAVSGPEERGVFHPCIDHIRVNEGRLKMPHSLELPGMRRPVVPLVGARFAFIDEFVVHRRPGLAAIVGSLDLLPKPTG